MVPSRCRDSREGITRNRFLFVCNALWEQMTFAALDECMHMRILSFATCLGAASECSAGFFIPYRSTHVISQSHEQVPYQQRKLALVASR